MLVLFLTKTRMICLIPRIWGWLSWEQSVDSSVHQGVGITIISRLFNFKFQILRKLENEHFPDSKGRQWYGFRWIRGLQPCIPSTQSLSVWQGRGCHKLGCSDNRSTVLPSFVGKSTTRFAIGILKVSISTQPLPNLTHSKSEKLKCLPIMTHSIIASCQRNSKANIMLKHNSFL